MRSDLDERKKMVLGILRNKVSDGLSAWIEHQFIHGADVEDVARSLNMAMHQLKRVDAYFADASRARMAEV